MNDQIPARTMDTKQPRVLPAVLNTCIRLRKDESRFLDAGSFDLALAYEWAISPFVLSVYDLPKHLRGDS